MPENNQLPTLKTIYAELTRVPVEKREQVLTQLGLSLNAKQTFYDIINGDRKLSPIEKEAIATIFEKKVDEIDWRDSPKLIA